MKLNIGPALANKILTPEVINDLLHDSEGKATITICPAVAIAGFYELFRELHAKGVEIEIDTQGLVFLPYYEYWLPRKTTKGIHLHRVRLTKKAA